MSTALASVAVLVLAVSAQLDAALAWERTELDSRPGAGDERVVSEFRFTNSGAAPVTIVSVRPSCSCTTARLEKTVYQPGESGVIAATFTIGDRAGEQRKTIVVRTDDAQHPTDTLLMLVHLPPQLEITPRVLAWGPGQPREPRAVDIILPEGLRTSVDGASIVSAKGGAFACELVTVEEGRRWRLQITPPSRDEAASATIAIAAGAKTYHVYAYVTKPAEPAQRAPERPAGP
jgi:hypothetical protein